jgi:2,5-diketo-D-gluconate reductase A
MAEQPRITLNDGNTIPQFGFGVWQVSNREAVDAVTTAINAGYLLIDTAEGYNNEEGVGEAVERSGKRDQLFITSKLRNSQQGRDTTLKAFDETMKKLRLDVLDLFLIHWPVPAAGRYAETWKAFVDLQKSGRVKSIGVSNFLPEHLDRIIGETGVTPAVNQVEIHPKYQQRDIRDYHREKGIVLEAYSPLGSGALLKDPVIAEIAKKHGKSPAQIMLAWALNEGFVVIPKSVTPERIRENIEVFDIRLDGEDLSKILTLDDPRNGKVGSHPAKMNSLF